MVLGTKELFDTMLAASGAGDVDTLEKRRAEFLEDDNNYALCVDSNGDTLLHKAVHPDPQTLLYVLDNLHARIDARNMLGKTALHEACKRNLLPCVNLLINRGADVLRTNEIGSTPFHTACSCGSVEAMERLLEIKDVDPNLVDGSGCFPIHKCSYDGNERVVDVLLKHNASIDVRDAQECTAVHIAVKMNRLDFVRKLLQIGEGQDFDINAGDKSGSTLLHYAVARCYHPMVKELLSRGADINKANEDGYTPLHIAAQSFQPDSQEWEDLVLDLLRMGADPNATNEMVGRTKYVKYAKALRHNNETKKPHLVAPHFPLPRFCSPTTRRAKQRTASC